MKDSESAQTLIQAAIAEHKQHAHEQGQILCPNSMQLAACLTEAFFKFQTLKEAKVLAHFIAQKCPNQTCSVIGITELFINAIEHGNLNITYEEKSQIKAQANWAEEIDQRLQRPENNRKFVTVHLKQSAQFIDLKIKDQGPGFDWRPYQNLVLKPERRLDHHGRGIFIAKILSFHDLRFSKKGNLVHCRIKLT